jgi:hypothetical protein
MDFVYGETEPAFKSKKDKDDFYRSIQILEMGKRLRKRLEIEKESMGNDIIKKLKINTSVEIEVLQEDFKKMTVNGLGALLYYIEAAIK